jgi:hypothetical protein
VTLAQAHQEIPVEFLECDTIAGLLGPRAQEPDQVPKVQSLAGVIGGSVDVLVCFKVCSDQ